MHDEVSINEIETVWGGFVRVVDHLLFDFLGEVGDVVDILPVIDWIGDTEGECEIETLDELVPEVMSLDHSEIFTRLVANGEFEGGTHGL